MTNFIDDNAIFSDNVEKDTFNRTPYAHKIAESILSKELKDINVYSIERSWGC